MPFFPAFIDISKKTVLIVGEGREAELKAEKLGMFCEKIIKCAYPPAFDEKPHMVFLTEKDNPKNEELAGKFRELGIPVNTADRPELCDFLFPSVIVKGNVTVGISTEGASPVLAAMLKERIEGCLPENLENLSQKAAELTAELRKSVPHKAERVRILKEMLTELINSEIEE